MWQLSNIIRRLNATVVVLAMASSALTGVVQAQGLSPTLQPEGSSGWTPKPLWRGSHFAVAAAHPLAAEAGARVLAEGGSAVDAAVAIQMVLTLVEPQSSGIGGGAFLLHADGQAVHAYDGRETAPAAADERLFLQADGQPLPFAQAVASGLSVGVPGVLPMLEMAHRRHGQLPWGRLMAPAIVLAEHGFPVSERLHTLLQADNTLRDDPEAAAYFLDPQGQPWPVGHRLRNPALAETLRCVAALGARCLSTGPIAEAMVRKVQHHPVRPGGLSLEDLVRYQPLQREPLCHPWHTPRGVIRLCGFPPPSSGAIAIGQILGMLAHRPTATPLMAEELHQYAEASRLAFADRARYIGDPAFVAPPGGDWLQLLRPDYLQRRAQLIGDTAMPTAPAGNPSHEAVAWGSMTTQPEQGTSHLSVIDSQGRSVAMTTTIESAFGSRLMVHGFLLNNQLTDFSFRPTDDAGRPVANRVQPGKRPRSSMAPTLVFDNATGELLASLGSPGGALIIHYTARALLATHLWGQDAREALHLPHAGSLGGPVLLEAGRYPTHVVEALKVRGHQVRETAMTSGLNLLQRDRQGLTGAADPRREGVVRGQ